MGCLGPCPAVKVVVSLFTALSTKVLFAIYGKGSTEATLAVCIYGVARRAARGATIPLPACGRVSGPIPAGAWAAPRLSLSEMNSGFLGLGSFRSFRPIRSSRSTLCLWLCLPLHRFKSIIQGVLVGIE